MTAVEWLVEQLDLNVFESDEEVADVIDKAIKMEKEQKAKLWTNEEVFDMLYKTDKFLMIDLREYWKTIKK